MSFNELERKQTRLQRQIDEQVLDMSLLISPKLRNLKNGVFWSENEVGDVKNGKKMKKSIYIETATVP